MRMRLMAALLAWSLFGFGYTGLATAQDEDEEEESDVDSLMASDPEQEEEEEEEEEPSPGEDSEKPPASPGEQQGDDERPPGEEPVVEEVKAAPPPEPESGPKNKLSAGVLIGYGISFEDANPWGFGFGARVGYNFGGFYVGGRLGFQLGSDFDSPRADNTGVPYTVKESNSLIEIGPEVGYDIFAGSVDIRPFLSLGIAVMSRSSMGRTNFDPDLDETAGHPFLAPGVALLFNVSDSFFLGIDARLMVVFRSLGEAKGLPLFGYIGMRF